LQQARCDGVGGVFADDEEERDAEMGLKLGVGLRITSAVVAPSYTGRPSAPRGCRGSAIVVVSKMAVVVAHRG
jgi:hypothetical protein